MLPYTITESSITVLLGGVPRVVDKSHPNFKAVIEAIKLGDEVVVSKLIDVAKAVVTYSNGKIQIVDGVVYHNGVELENYAVSKLLQFMKDGFDVTPIINFLNNLMENPSYRAVQELYKFLEVGGVPLTEDGCFVVYKKVRADFKDIYSGTYNNSVGATPTMPRNEVDDNSERTCSAGLHVCSFNYLAHFGSSKDNRVVACKVNPIDVVSIPKDYGNTKMRVCRYEVIADVTEKALGGDFLRGTVKYMEEEKTVPNVSNNKKSVAKVGTVTNAILEIFPSAKDAEDKTGVFATNITKCCKGLRETAGGFKWQYV
jgi:hypothetical protein